MDLINGLFFKGELSEKEKDAAITEIEKISDRLEKFENLMIS